MRTFALFAFQDSGRCNLICAVQAEDDEQAALSLGGQLVSCPLGRDEMMVIGMRLPSQGIAWSQFRFGFGENFERADEAIEALGTALGQQENVLYSVANLAGNSDRLILKEVIVLRAELRPEAEQRPEDARTKKTEPHKKPARKAR